MTVDSVPKGISISWSTSRYEPWFRTIIDLISNERALTQLWEDQKNRRLTCLCEDLLDRIQPLDLEDRRNIESLVAIFQKNRVLGKLSSSQWWEWYQNVPAWLAALKTYSKEFPGAIGHCVTPAGPSAQLLPLWKNPCQCCGTIIRHKSEILRRPSYNCSACQHRCVGQTINDIEMECIVLRKHISL